MAPVLETDLAWIRDDTATGMTVRSLIPGRYDAYGLLDLEDEASEHEAVDDVLLRTLGPLDDDVLIVGWIERGDVVNEPGDRHELYAHWRYRLRRVTADELRDASRRRDAALPDLVFPVDRSWLISTGWDDSWRSIGASLATARRLRFAVPTFEPIEPDTDISTTGRDVR